MNDANMKYISTPGSSFSPRYYTAKIYYKSTGYLSCLSWAKKRGIIQLERDGKSKTVRHENGDEYNMQRIHFKHKEDKNEFLHLVETGYFQNVKINNYLPPSFNINENNYS